MGVFHNNLLGLESIKKKKIFGVKSIATVLWAEKKEIGFWTTLHFHVHFHCIFSEDSNTRVPSHYEENGAV